MKKFLTAILVSLIAFVTPSFSDEQQVIPAEAESVGIIVGDNGSCSAVVVSYDTIVTARHCDIASFQFIYKNQKFRIINTEADHVTHTDTMSLKVDGYLEGPYQKIYRGEVPAGTEIMTIGYAYGETLAIGTGKSRYYGVLAKEIFDIFDFFGLVPGNMSYEDVPYGQICGKDPFCTGDSLIHDAFLAPGMSGGGTYAKINGKWELVAVNSWLLRDPFMGVPLEYGSAPINHLKVPNVGRS